MNNKQPNAQAIYDELLSQVRRAASPTPLLLVGIHTGGAWIAQRLAADLAESGPELGFLSSAFHRDDIAQRGLPSSMKSTQLPLSIDDREIILVDDILFTGRTVRAALNELFDYGRPRSVKLAVLVDRGGRQLPFQPDFCGSRIELAAGENLRLSQDTAGRFDLAIVREEQA